MYSYSRIEQAHGYLWEGAHRLAAKLPKVELHLHLDGRCAAEGAPGGRLPPLLPLCMPPLCVRAGAA